MEEDASTELVPCENNTSLNYTSVSLTYFFFY